MCDETPQERQNNEIEVLKSIFGNDVVDIRVKQAWKIWRPLDLLLTLNPLHSSSAGGVHCSITLHITCCNMYPDKPPHIEVHKMNGVSNENAAILLEQLGKLAQSLCGEVMIYELAQHVQNFLYEHNKPQMSFYEEMLERKNEQERLRKQDLQIKETQERQKIKDEIEKRQAILRAEGRRYRNSLSQEESTANDSTEPELVYYADKKMPGMYAKRKAMERHTEPQCTCTSKGLQIIRITQRNHRKVHVGKCLGHSSTGATTNLAIDAESGEFLVVKKWVLVAGSPSLNRALQQLDQEAGLLGRLRGPHLATYTALEMQQETLDQRRRVSVPVVYLFRDFVLGTSLRNLRLRVRNSSDSPEGLRLLRHVARGVLSGLRDLHAGGLLHRDLREETVFLEDAGGVRIVGASLDVRLQGLLDEKDYCEGYSKSQDIFACALLLLALISEGGAGGHEIPSRLPGAARDFFSRCLTEDEQLQWSCSQLLQHAFICDAPALSPRAPPAREHDDGYSGSEEEEKAFAESLLHRLAPAAGRSRLSAEFETLEWLGKGAFGDVLKVKNKLDGGFYAIKRIKLNPNNIQFNKKITREVKLLSRLNHEHVVRYYNAWIETIQGNDFSDGTESEITTENGTKDLNVNKDDVITNKNDVLTNKNDVITNKNDVNPHKNDVNAQKIFGAQKGNVIRTESNTHKKDANRAKKDTLEGAVAKLAPNVRLEWSISETSKSCIQQQMSTSDSDSSDSEDEDDGWIKMLPTTTETDEDSASIEFQVEGQQESETAPSEGSTEPSSKSAPVDQVLYIQMEFCEKHTLRQAIDNGLYLEHVRAWRLFRELVEGLGHVHQRGMIHRDLKPPNIFLDSADHVKIGDFGLATNAFSLPLDNKHKNQEEYGGSLTGQVGTALYVAPELLQAGHKVIYNQKVDIYSLGIILFEMFHRKLDTGMERMQVLSALRGEAIVLPADFIREENARQIHVIRWLLSHDAGARPSCAELLASEHVPRAVADSALAGLLAHTLADRRTRAYGRLVRACMDQPCERAHDLTYHAGHRGADRALVAARDAVVKVFKRHGADEFCPPLLLPRLKAWDQCPNAVKLMTSHGSVVHLPHDLRLPFARYVAFNDVRYMRRYVVERVYREKHAAGFHPRELLECAFDIVVPAHAHVWPDAELIAVASAALAETGVRASIQLNHTAILRGVLAACGVPADKHADLYPVLVDVRTGRITSLQLQTHLTSLCLSARDTALLLRLMEAEVGAGAAAQAPGAALAELLAPVAARAGGAAGALARAVRELDAVVACARALGVECSLSCAPCMAYNAPQHRGVFWQALAPAPGGPCGHAQRPRAPHRARHLVAVGGRYTALVEEFWKVARSQREDASELMVCAVGLSISLERIAAISRKVDAEAGGGQVAADSKTVCVCVWGGGDDAEGAEGDSRSALAGWRAAQLARELWASGARAALLPARSAAEARDLADFRLALLLDERAVRVACWDADRVSERVIALAEAVDFVKQKLQIDSVRPTPDVGGRGDAETRAGGGGGGGPQLSVMIITEERLSNAARRRHEMQAMSAGAAALGALGVRGSAGGAAGSSAGSRCVVLAGGWSAECVRLLAGQLDAPLQPARRPDAAAHALHAATDKYPRYRKILSEAMDIITNMANSRNTNDDLTLLALYSIPDGLFKLIT